MPKSKRPVRSVKQVKKNNQNLNVYIRVGAIAVILVVLGAIIWAIVSSQKPAASTSSDAYSLTTTAMVNSLPASGALPTAADTEPVGTPLPTVIKTLQYTSAPPMTIDKSKQYTATFTMAKGGQFVIQLYPDKAPITVNSFVFLARQRFFDGVTFHRVLPGFMAQGGDPTGTGSGGPGYQFVNEDNDLKFDKAGVVAMANAGRNTNGSQFFITFAPYPSGNGGYTIFGQVISGMDVVSKIKLRDPETNPTYPGDAILTVTIAEK